MPTSPLYHAAYRPAIDFAGQFITGHCDSPFLPDDVASQMLLAYQQTHGDDADLMYGLAYELVDRACSLRNNGARSCYHPDLEAMRVAMEAMDDPCIKRGSDLAAAFAAMLTHDIPIARAAYLEAMEDDTKLGAFFGVLIFELQQAHLLAHLVHAGCSRGRLRPPLN